MKMHGSELVQFACKWITANVPDDENGRHTLGP